MDQPRTAAAMVTAAKQDLEELDPEQFDAETRDERAVVVDLREADERAAGAIAGSIHIPRGMLEFRADPSSAYHDPDLHPRARVLLHCASGGRSALAAQTLRSMGYEDVAHLAGGINAWKDAGKPVV